MSWTDEFGRTNGTDEFGRTNGTDEFGRTNGTDEFGRIERGTTTTSTQERATK